MIFCYQCTRRFVNVCNRKRPRWSHRKRLLHRLTWLNFCCRVIGNQVFSEDSLSKYYTKCESGWYHLLYVARVREIKKERQ